eukprot:TRINITY_DN50356_c0_g1_i1.p1 TRINITY_DN50356_c0_g1~~TRINITY_DN50356_c0_g1_i1.p1  ORF type:complete len:806 (-),score=173.70 TRINITY_DN50356_c0_g1_i1:2-2155(-)
MEDLYQDSINKNTILYQEWTDIMPSPQDFVAAIKNSKAGKQHGLDLIPIDVLKAAAPEAASHIHAVAVKAIATGIWPVRWAGDVHIALPKGGGKVRGVSLEDSMAKVCNKYMRGKLMQELQESGQLPADTYGCLPSRGTAMAIFARNMMIEHVNAKKMPYALIYIDLNAAFDKVKRSTIKETLGQNKPIHTVVQAIHSGTYITTPHSCKAIATESGVKQGDPIADAVFVGVFGRLVAGIRSRLKEEGATLAIKMKDGRLFSDDGTERFLDLLEIAYVDDMMIVATDKRSDQLIEKVIRAIKVTKEEVAKGGFTLNTSKGKTEVFLKFKGRAAMKMRRAIQHDPYVRVDEETTVGVVDRYTHLGSTCAENLNGQFVTDFKRRMATKYKDYERVLKHKGYDDRVKKKVVNIVTSAALYGAQAITRSFSKGQIEKMEAKYHQLLRTATNNKHNPRDPEDISNYNMRVVYEYPSLRTILRLRRLSFLPTLFKRAPDTIRALIEDSATRKGDWYKMLKEDLEWLITNGDNLEIDAEDMSKIEDMICNDENGWKKILQEIYDQDVKGLISEEGLPSQEQDNSEVMTCFECHKELKNARALSLHRLRSHGRRTLAQAYAGQDAQCRWCQTKFGARDSLVRHYRNGYKQKASASCLAQLQLWQYQAANDEEICEYMQADKEYYCANRCRGWHPQKAKGVHEKGKGPMLLLKQGPVWYDLQVHMDD